MYLVQEEEVHHSKIISFSEGKESATQMLEPSDTNQPLTIYRFEEEKQATILIPEHEREEPLGLATISDDVNKNEQQSTDNNKEKIDIENTLRALENDPDPLTIMIYNFIKNEYVERFEIEPDLKENNSVIVDNIIESSPKPMKRAKLMKRIRRKIVHECNFCLKIFNRSSALVQHIRIHTGDKPLKCEFCEKAFNTSSSLSRHRKIHTDTRIHLCEICSKLFSTPIDLQKHHRIHTGEKPYKCTECCKSFAQFGNLNAHLKSHFGIKPHRCDLCSKGFASYYKMILHRKIHTGEKDYKCDFLGCEKSFTQKTHLVQHRKTHFAKELRNYEKQQKSGKTNM